MFTELLLRARRQRRSYSSTGSIRVCQQLEIECLEERQLLASPPVIFLTAPVLAALQQQAASNTPQWQAFKAELDSDLPVVPGPTYEGGELQAISDYALGYQILQTIDPVTAANYADKAIALMKSALFDYQKDGSITRQFLARGNGLTTTFTLPNSNIISSSVNVYLAPVTTQAVVHGALNGQDSIGFNQKVIKVSNTPDGNPDYLEGVDWFRNPNLSEDLIDWSLPGKEPAVGATYYVTSTQGMFAPPTSFTLNGNTITLPTAPTINQAVYVEYVYGTRAPDYSTLAYQMTSAGDGGFNSIFIDASYTARFLGKHLSMGLDWLWNYPGLSAPLKSQIISMLVRWSDYERDYAYLRNSPGSNMGVGGYISRVMTALALLNRDPAGARILSEILQYRQTYVIPTLTGASPSLRGGFWAEGWSYGQLAAQNLLLGGLALEIAGQIPAATAERQWASQAIDSLISAQPTPTSLYDGGDWYNYPAYLPNNNLFDVLAYMANDPVAQSYANYIIQSRPKQTLNTYLDLLFQKPSAPASFWGSFPLQYYADGTGLVTARTDWSYQSTWMSFQLGNLLPINHQTFAPGQLQIQRGSADLLISANTVAGNTDPFTKSSFSNLIAINDNGAGLQDYPWNMGEWYGSPGVFISNYEATANYVYVGGDYRAAYSPQANPGSGGPATQLTRQVVYLRPDFIIVHDRAGTVQASFPKQLQWHFLNPATVTGNSWVETVGNSSLFADTFSSVPLTTTAYPVTMGTKTVYRVATNNTNQALNVQYTTALETALSTVTSMVATRQVVSTNGVMEGVQEGNDLVLFGVNGPVNASSISYSVGGSGSVFNLLTDLQPNQVYKVSTNGVVVATLTASAQGTISFTAAAGTTSITVTTSGGGTGNPLPTLSTLSQTSAVEGAGSSVLTITGTGFISSSVVQWNGTPLATTYVSGTQLTATVPASDLADEGAGNITVVNPAPGGGTSTAASFTISDATLSATAATINVTPGVAFSGTVATFTDGDSLAPLSDFTSGAGSATINWGDGTANTTGTITQPGGVGTQFIVAGSHTYQTSGSHTVTVTINDKGGSTVTVTTVTGTGTSNPVPSISTLSQTSAVEGAGSLSLTITGAGFISASVVKWNGTALVTTLVSSTQLTATIPASDLAEQGTGKITVVNPAPGGGTSAAASFTINDAALTASGVAVTGTEGTSFSGQVATFTDADPKAPLTDFTTGSGGVTISWGDGTTSAGAVTQPGGVGTAFVVNGSHTYSDQGSYTVTVAISDLGGSTKSITASATIADATLTATGTPITVSPGFPFSGQVATFTDANPSAPLSDFTTGSGGATINWGDGSPNTTGTITQPAGVGTQFVVTGSHTYPMPGSYTVTVTIKDKGGSTVTVTTTAGPGGTSAKSQEIMARVQQSGQWWLGTSTGTSFTTSLWGSWDPTATWLNVLSGDFVGNGKTDIAGWNAETGQWWVAYNGPSGFTTKPWTTWSTAVTWVDVQVGDFNGDGKADIIGRVAGTGQWWVALSTGSSFTTTLWSTWSSAVTWTDTRVGDFNGDGKSDVASRALESGQWWVGLSIGSSFGASLWSTWSTAVTWVDVQVGDFNGDGKADLTARVLQSGQWWTAVSTGNGFLTSLWGAWDPSITWVDVQVGDFNGDGKQDLLGRKEGTGDWWVSLSTGSGFNTTLWASWNPAITWVDAQVGDFNGDGKDDITARDSQTGNWWTGLSTGSSFRSSIWATWSPSVTWVDVHKGIFV